MCYQRWHANSRVRWGIESRPPFAAPVIKSGPTADIVIDLSKIWGLGGEMVAMMQRRALLGGTMGAVTLAAGSTRSVTAATAQSPIDHAPPEPLVWPSLVKLPSG